MHVVLCLLVVVHCICAKTKENEFGRTTFTPKNFTLAEEEEISYEYEVTSNSTASIKDSDNSESMTFSTSLSIQEVDESGSGTFNKYSSETTDVSSNFFTSSPYTSVTTEASCDEIPALEIRNLAIINVNNFNATVKWEAPESAHCVEEYVVYLNNKRFNITKDELLVINSNACETNTVGVAVFNGFNQGKIKNVSFTTTAPNPFSYSVESLEIKSFEKNFKVTWKLPTDVSRCNTSYYVEWRYNGIIENTTITTRHINIPNIPCRQYNITVYPQINTLKGLPRSTSYTTRSYLPKIDHLTIVQAASFQVSLQWEPPEYSNCFERYIVYLGKQKYGTTRDSKFVISPLNACQEFEIGVGVFNGTHYGSVNSKKNITKAPKPFSYSVGKLEYEEFDRTLNLTWKPPPPNVLQCVTNYAVFVQWEEDEETRNETILTTKYEAQVTIIPCVQYEIQVYPLNHKIMGLPQSMTYTAMEYPTIPPQIVQNATNKTEAQITWEIDDTSNKCALEQLVVVCNATDDLNDDFSWIIKEKTVVMDVNSTDVTMIIDGLSPFTNYTCLAVVTNIAGNSSTIEFEFSTEQDVPSKPPEIEVVNFDAHRFVIQWSEPKENPGILTGYHILIHNKFVACNSSHELDTELDETVSASQTFYEFTKALPYHEYEISVYGINGAGNGDVATINHTSKTFVPDPVTDLKLHRLDPEKIVITFKPPCYLNGPFQHYEICVHGRRDEDYVTNCTTTTQTFQEIDLKPEHHYTIEVRVFNIDFTSSPATIEHETDPDIPLLGTKLQAPSSNETRKSYFRFSKDAFDDSKGKVLYYALKLSPKASPSETGSGLWDYTWPIDSITPAGWNPFQNGTSEIVFIIGENETCTEHYCNKPLDEDTEYTLIVRGYTTKTYADTAPLEFRTLKPSKTGLILGLVFGFLILLSVPVALFLWKRANTIVGTNDEKLLPTSPTPILCTKFCSLYETLIENPNILKSQFAALGAQSKEVAATTSYGVLPENKRKNRYTNILPYDHTRVKLQIDEDDEISSDYINASYIKGYSGRVEYIATQGPLESTSKDFWKMIVQENVTMIVMVSQFIEQSKEKCYQYFPNNHEKVSFGETLDVRCSTELHFGTYCIRTLQVRKDTEQRNVIHVQYLEWPDFGVPQSTENVLQLCYQLREKARTEGGLIVIHCSAGVGRTGTLIALDILLQTIERQKTLSIYNTVFELRKQRVNMVQTEKQYVFLHTCIRDYLQSPRVIQTNDPSLDHTYENMDILRSSLTKNLLEMESESVL